MASEGESSVAAHDADPVEYLARPADCSSSQGHSRRGTPAQAQSTAASDSAQFGGFLTANTTCAESLKQLLTSTTADVVLAQELRVHGASALSLQAWTTRNGWKCILAEAAVSPDTGKPSAGVGVFARQYLGLGNLPSGPLSTKDGRAVAAMVEVPGIGALCAIAAYFWVSEELTERNLQLLGTIGQWCSLNKLPFLVGADFNMHPSVLETTAVTDMLHAEIIADLGSIGTCTQDGSVSTIDYFLVSSDLAEATTRVSIVPNAPIATHRPVLLEARSDATELTRIIAVAPQKIPPVPVFGPLPQQPSWSSACNLAERAVRQARTAKRPTSIRYAISEAYGEWARTAEIELASAAGVELQPKRRKRGAPFRTRVVPLIGSTSPPQ